MTANSSAGSRRPLHQLRKRLILTAFEEITRSGCPWNICSPDGMERFDAYFSASRQALHEHGGRNSAVFPNACSLDCGSDRQGEMLCPTALAACQGCQKLVEKHVVLSSRANVRALSLPYFHGDGHTSGVSRRHLVQATNESFRSKGLVRPCRT